MSGAKIQNLIQTKKQIFAFKVFEKQNLKKQKNDMKNLTCLLFLSISVFCYSQKISLEQAEKSNDLTVVSAFIKQNPDHPRVPEFKRKLVAIMNNDKTPTQKKSVAKPEVKPINKEEMKSEVKKSTASNSKSSTSSQNQKTADMLTHMFNNDPNSKEAYVQIVNKSKCNLIVKISGKKFYNLTVPANNQNFILVDKGSYTLTSSICDAKYSSSKKISQDISITLNAPTKR